MRIPAFAAFGMALWAGSAQAASVDIRDAVARVTVIPEDRSDIRVEMLTRHPKLPLEVRTSGDRVIVDGRLNHRIRACRGEGDDARVHVLGVGEVTYDAMPQVVIRTPRAVKVGAGGAIFGVIGKSASVELDNAGCGHWTIANVQGRLKIYVAGSGDTAAGAAGEANLRIAGSGGVRTRDIHGGLTADIAGSGDVDAQSVSGPVDIKVAGSGDVKIAGGHATTMSVSIAGSGGVKLDGVADTLNARIAGSGDVRVKQVTGAVTKAVVGSGGVVIG